MKNSDNQTQCEAFADVDPIYLANSCCELEATATFTSSAIPPPGGSGGDEGTSWAQRKRIRDGNDLSSEMAEMRMDDLDSKSRKQPSPTLKNPIDQLEDLEMTDEDCAVTAGKHGLNVSFSNKVHNKLDYDWRCAVVVKLMGKPNSVNAFDFMLGGLRRKWKLKGGWCLIDLPNDYYIVKFNLEEDMNSVLCDGPWILAGQTLLVQKWRPDFDPLEEKICRMALWVRICGLPVKYFKHFTIAKIGKIIGDVVEVDQVTLAQARGKFARVCIEVDMNKPLRPFVEVENVAYGVVYEGIFMICFECGCYGHVKDKCPFVQVVNQLPSTVTEMPASDGQLLAASSTNGASVFGFGLSNGASSTSMFPFVSSATSTAPSQPAFGNSNPFAFPTAPSSNNDQMRMEDSMAEETVHASPITVPVFSQQPVSTPQSAPTVPVFGRQPVSTPQSPFVFGGPNTFQFPNPANPQNPSPFQASSSLGTGGGCFSLGGGKDKSYRRFVKVRRNKPRKK